MTIKEIERKIASHNYDLYHQKEKLVKLMYDINVSIYRPDYIGKILYNYSNEILDISENIKFISGEILNLSEKIKDEQAKKDYDEGKPATVPFQK